MPGPEAPIQVMAEVQCSCGNVWEVEACDHMGALDLYDPACPVCGDEDPEILEVHG